MERQYFDANLKNQAKQRLFVFHEGLRRFHGIIHDSHEYRDFSGRQAWRNPALFRISLPKGRRFEFILFTKIWLARPPRFQLNIGRQIPYIRPICFAQINQERILKRQRRLYQYPSGDVEGCIMDDHPVNGKKLLKGDSVLYDTLSGEMDLLLIHSHNALIK